MKEEKEERTRKGGRGEIIIKRNQRILNFKDDRSVYIAGSIRPSLRMEFLQIFVGDAVLFFILFFCPLERGDEVD